MCSAGPVHARMIKRRISFTTNGAAQVEYRVNRLLLPASRMAGMTPPSSTAYARASRCRGARHDDGARSAVEGAAFADCAGRISSRRFKSEVQQGSIDGMAE